VRATEPSDVESVIARMQLQRGTLLAVGLQTTGREIYQKPRPEAAVIVCDAALARQFATTKSVRRTGRNLTIVFCVYIWELRDQWEQSVGWDSRPDSTALECHPTGDWSRTSQSEASVLKLRKRYESGPLAPVNLPRKLVHYSKIKSSR